MHQQSMESAADSSLRTFYGQNVLDTPCTKYWEHLLLNLLPLVANLTGLQHRLLVIGWKKGEEWGSGYSEVCSLSDCFIMHE